MHSSTPENIQTVLVINGETVKITTEIHPPAQQPTLEINYNLLVTFFFFFSPSLLSLEREERMKKVCLCVCIWVWPWKLIRTRYSDNQIKVMETMSVCCVLYTPVRVCVVWVDTKCSAYWLLIIFLSVQSWPLHQQQSTGVYIDPRVANFC